MALSFPHVARADLDDLTVIARWLGASRAIGARVATLVGGPVHARGIAATPLGDPYAGRCEVRADGASIEVLGASAGVRHIAQRLLGGPPELAAPRPLGAVEHAVWSLAIAAALEDLGIAGEVWPCEAPVAIEDARELAIEIDLAGAPFTVAIRAPRSLALRVPRARVPAWADRAFVDAEIVVGRCAIACDARLALRAIVTLDRVAGGDAELCLLGGTVGLACREPSRVVAEVATGYVPRAMSLPDQAHVELTVGLGTTRLSLRQVFELAVGQVVPLGRPLAGPFEIRAAGALVGDGELVDVDGELGVRIIRLASQE